jgi:hypothetical protein
MCEKLPAAPSLDVLSQRCHVPHGILFDVYQESGELYSFPWPPFLVLDSMPLLAYPATVRT